MCVYCNMGDHTFKYDPPWRPRDYPIIPPYVPAPVRPFSPDYEPWPVDQLKEYLKLLQEVKEMEDKLGCPCEPNKANYIKLLEERIKFLKQKKKKPKARSR